MVTPAQNSFWQMIDGVFVINLDQRADRWAQFQAAVSGIIPPEKLHRLPARLGREISGFGQRPWFRGGKRDRTWAARAGVTQSHRQALLNAREADWRTVLILEDDVNFATDFSALTTALAAALREQDWQLCYLGFTDPWSPCRKLTDLDAGHGLFRVHGCNTAHAYLVRETARDWLLGQLPDETRVWKWLATHRAIDRWMQRHVGLEFPVACVSPSIVNQVEGFSDIVEQQTHYTGATEHVRTVRSVSGNTGFYFGHALRRVSVRIGLAGDSLRGLAKRVTGF
ncbi:MAG: glycosyl transferase [Verrucomicrobiota bacterium]